MTVYSVYEPPIEAPDVAERADRLTFVKEGFSWPALFVPLLWLLYYRMWIEFIVLVLVYVALQVVFGTDPQGQTLAAWASLAVGVLFALRGERPCARCRSSGAATGSPAWHPAATGPKPSVRSSPPGCRDKRMSRGRPGVGASLAASSEAAPPVPRGEGEEVIGLFPRP